MPLTITPLTPVFCARATGVDIARPLDDASFARDPHLATWFHPAPYGIYQVADEMCSEAPHETDTAP